MKLLFLSSTSSKTAHFTLFDHRCGNVRLYFAAVLVPHMHVIKLWNVFIPANKCTRETLGHFPIHVHLVTQYATREININIWNTTYFALLCRENLLWDFVVTVYCNNFSDSCLLVTDAYGTLSLDAFVILISGLRGIWNHRLHDCFRVGEIHRPIGRSYTRMETSIYTEVTTVKKSMFSCGNF